MNWLAIRCLDRPGLTLWIGLMLTLAVGAGALHLELRTDGDALLPEGHPVVLQNAEDRDRFRDPREILLVVNQRDGAPSLATPAGFRFLHGLHSKHLGSAVQPKLLFQRGQRFGIRIVRSG